MKARSLVRFTLLLAFWASFALTAFSQEQTDDVIRVNTELVQTDFMVFDKQGKFVDGLKRDQFILKVDGKPRDISFLDSLAAGSRSEEAQIAAARGASGPGIRAPLTLDRGRTVLFFVDDLHLGTGGISYARELIKHFIESDMKQNDQAEIVASSDQLGFLQQLTDNKSVLLFAADRLRYQQIVDIQGSEYPPMTEYQSMQIQRGDTELFNFLVDKLLERTPRFPRVQAEQIIRGRARALVNQGASVLARSLTSLKGLVNLVEPLPGRKIVIFISDGFLIDQARNDNWDRVQRITNAAARSGVIIYSIDARGLAGILEPTDQDRMVIDPRGILRRASSGEFHATQDGMSSLAGDTGGRAFFNSNNIQGALSTALKESSMYYLLAWRPEADEQRNPKFRKIELSVIDRPDLSVRFRRGIGEAPDDTAKKKAKESDASPVRKKPDEEIRAVLSAPYPNRKIPVAISLNFLDTAQYGGTLRTAIKVRTGSLRLDQQTDGAPSDLDVGVVVLNDQGKSVNSYNQRFTIAPPAGNTSNQPPESVSFDHVAQVKPGLYQVRVAVIDVKTGARGSAFEWIEVPNLAGKQLTMSSLVIGERKAVSEAQRTAASAADPREAESTKELPVNVEHRFAKSSYLRLLTFIYNAATSDSKPAGSDPNAASPNLKAALDLAVQVQVFRENEPVVTTPLHKIQTDAVADVQRVPYAAEVDLGGLAPGAYILQVTVIDRLAKASTTRKLNFQIE
jgi:VWFA-related protein